MQELIRVIDNVNPFYSQEEDIRTFAECLYSKEVFKKYKGSVVICKKIYNHQSRKKDLKQISWSNLNNYNYVELELLKRVGEEDVYININPVRNFKNRTKENLHQYKFLYVDLDIEEAREKGKLDLTINQVLYKIKAMCKDNVLPLPTLTVNSGRGLHLYWSIGNYANTNKNRVFWEDMQKQIYLVLKEFGADRSIVTDCVRVLRVPGTINSKNKAQCFIEEYNPNCLYSLLDIRDKYFKEQLDVELIEKKHKAELRKQKLKEKRIVKDNNVVDLSKSKTVFTLHKARLEDLIKLIKMRKGDFKGNRNIALLQIAYWYAVTHKLDTLENVLEFTLEVNQLFSEELDNKEVEHVVKHAFNYATKKIELDKNRGLQNKENMGSTSVLKNTSLNQYSVNNNSSTLGLNYSNTTLLELFNISSVEMLELKTLIDIEEKNRRKLVRERSKRRTEESGEIGGTKITPKQKEQLEKKKKANALKNEGLSLREISKELDCSIGSIRNLLN